jgi:hypothetical protein
MKKGAAQAVPERPLLLLLECAAGHVVDKVGDAAPAVLAPIE